MNFYELLGVSKNASKEEIKNAYKSLVKKYHPDINKNVDDSIIKNLNEAKEILLDDIKRREYDLALEELNNSKEFSKEKNETYYSKSQDYKETYSQAYVTRWDFFVNYVKNSVDKFYKKILKCLLATLNYLFFFLIRIMVYLITYVCFLFQELIDFISGLLLILALLGLFVLAKDSNNSLFSFIPYNIQVFSILTFISIFIELIKIFILNGSVNIFRFIQKLHDKLFILILNKI